MAQTSWLLLPRQSLAGCLFAAIVRDTRGCALSDVDRFNHFPASPLVALTIVIEGEIRLAQGDLAQYKSARALPPLTVAGPKSEPLTSWNPGPVFAISIGFYPDAWALLSGMDAAATSTKIICDIPEGLARIFEAGPPGEPIGALWERWCDELDPFWSSVREEPGAPIAAQHSGIRDWVKSITAKAVLSGPGMSIRSAERRLRRWTGQNRQLLALHSQIENLHGVYVKNGAANLALTAADAGFSDQSHMGRQIRRVTGFSPGQLNRLIATQEAFWCYRLLGERF